MSDTQILLCVFGNVPAVLGGSFGPFKALAASAKITLQSRVTRTTTHVVDFRSTQVANNEYSRWLEVCGEHNIEPHFATVASLLALLRRRKAHFPAGWVLPPAAEQAFGTPVNVSSAQRASHGAAAAPSARGGGGGGARAAAAGGASGASASPERGVVTREELCAYIAGKGNKCALCQSRLDIFCVKGRTFFVKCVNYRDQNGQDYCTGGPSMSEVKTWLKNKNKK